LSTQNGRHRHAACCGSRGAERRRGKELTAAKFPLFRHDDSPSGSHCGAKPRYGLLFKVLELGFTILPTLDKAATVKEDLSQ
jgi:hypothetical protein